LYIYSSTFDRFSYYLFANGDAIRMTSRSQTTTFRHGEDVGGGGGRVNESNNAQARVFRIPGGQMIFYIITGLVHIPIAVWMLKDKHVYF
jgi:hypothetical protein